VIKTMIKIAQKYVFRYTIKRMLHCELTGGERDVGVKTSLTEFSVVHVKLEERQLTC